MSRLPALNQANSSTSFINFKPKHVVIVSKQTALEFELQRFRKRHQNTLINVTDDQLLIEMEKNMPNVDQMKLRHEQQLKYVKDICDELSQHQIEYKVTNRHKYTVDMVDWCDLVISAGGDGTFLTAASKVHNQTPVIGINTDPIGSEGHLCLTGKSNRPVNEVIRQFLNNDFRWTYRQRIRVTVVDQVNPKDLHVLSDSLFSDKSYENETNDSEDIQNISTNSVKECDSGFIASQSPPFNNKKINFNFDDQSEGNNLLDFCENKFSLLALNEVFMGESHAARVSYYDVQIDDGPLMKQKSSGMTICTGTGSTSWHYNINRLTEFNLKEILQIAAQMGFSFVADNNTDSFQKIDDFILEEICKRFNKKLVFEPEAEKMAFSIRDPVFNATFSKTNSHGFAKRIRIKSRCTHAHLILDGSTSIPFNRGSEVILEIHPDDALRTVALNTI